MYCQERHFLTFDHIPRYAVTNLPVSLVADIIIDTKLKRVGSSLHQRSNIEFER
jgi:hypothetical protein